MKWRALFLLGDAFERFAVSFSVQEASGGGVALGPRIRDRIVNLGAASHGTVAVTVAGWFVGSHDDWSSIEVSPPSSWLDSQPVRMKLRAASPEASLWPEFSVSGLTG